MIKNGLLSHFRVVQSKSVLDQLQKRSVDQ